MNMQLSSKLECAYIWAYYCVEARDAAGLAPEIMGAGRRKG